MALEPKEFQDEPPNQRTNLVQRSTRAFQKTVRKVFPVPKMTEESQAVLDNRLQQALDNGQPNEIKTALTQRANVNTRGTNHGKTALLFAISHDFDMQDMVKLILGNTNVDINARDNTGNTALSYAVQKVDEDLVEKLLDRGAQVDQDLLHRLPESGGTTTTISRLLIQAGARMDSRDETGKTPLLALCAKPMFFGDKDMELAKLYLDYGADPTARDGSGQTALAWAVRSRYMPCSPSAMTATSNSQQGIVKLLLGAGGMGLLNQQDGKGRTPLMRAVETGVAAIYDPLEKGVNCQCEIISLLLDRGAVIDARDQGGWTALWVAVLTETPRLAVVKLLIERGGDLGVRDNNGEALLSRVIEKHGRDDGPVIKLLREHSMSQA
ncbi:Ankyrin repeat-containing domain protein [Rhypophila sp. PSN 637]